MTEIVLSSLLNLFALYGKGGDVDMDGSKLILANYIRRHFGIRDTEFWIGMYQDLRELYSVSPDLDIESVVSGICTNLQGKLASTEEKMMVLRLMEFCAVDGLSDYERGLLNIVADRFHVSEDMFADFVSFVTSKESEHVRIYSFDGLDGHIRTLILPALHRMVFAYTGEDQLMLNDVPVLSGSFQVMQKSGVLKSRHSQPIYYSTLCQGYDRQSDADRKKVEFCGRAINFRFPNSDNGMHDLSFTLQSGQLLAIMGGSGTGKSTLLSLLNGSLKPQSGTITINGHSIQEPQARNLIGFVPQDDLLIEELTVRQNLLYTARFCFEGMPGEELNRRVDDTLRNLGLEATADLRVGSPLNKTISGGQRKRLNIALELIREPAVLFLDEPTSGLSSADTEMVINLLKEQTYNGKLVIVNIHQPSSDVYKLFDRLWILDKGGYPVFDGNPIDAITYFKTAANYADSETSACPTCGNVNPEVVLNIIDEKSLNEFGELSDRRKTTPAEWHQLYLEKSGNAAVSEELAVSDVPMSEQRRPSRFKQFRIFLERNLMTKVSSMQSVCVTLLSAPVLAIVCALLTRYAPATGYSLLDNKNFVSYLFMAVIVATFIGMSASAEEIIRDRSLLKREHFLHLSYGSYISSKITFCALISLVQTLLFVAIGNVIMGIQGMFLLWWGILFSVSFLSNIIGLLLSQCLSSIVAIYISIPMLLIPQILLCGVVVDFADLTPRSTTGNVPIVGNLIPSRWAYEALAVSSFADNLFEADYFPYDKEKYETQFYDKGYLYEIKSQLQSKRDEERQGKEVPAYRMQVIHNSLPVVARFAGIKPYDGDYSYDSLHAWLDQAQQQLSLRGNQATLAADRMLAGRIRQSSRQQQQQLKRDNVNSQLSDMVLGMRSPRLVEVIDGHIVPRACYIYLTPLTTCGNAPFYSSTKILGPYHIKTLWFNLSVLYLMSILLALLLYADVPGRYMRKENN